MTTTDPGHARAAARLDALMPEVRALVLRPETPAFVRGLLALVPRRAEVAFRASAGTAELAWDHDAQRFVVAIGPAILNDEIRDADDLLYLICHELLHLVRGDHGLLPGKAMLASNIAADALNDAWLTGPALGGYFSPVTSLAARRGCSTPVIALLTPLPAAAVLVGVEAGQDPLSPHVSRALFERCVPPPPGVDAYTPRRWADVHHALQMGGRDDTLGLEVATRLVAELMASLDPARWWVPDELAVRRPPLPPSALRALARLRRTVDGLRAESGRRTRKARRRSSGSGAAGAGSEAPLETIAVEDARASRRLERFLRGFVATAAGGAERWSALGPTPRASEAGSRVERRAVAECGAGIRATPFAVAELRGGDVRVGLELYLDASGSMLDVLAPIVATLARRCSDVLALPVRAFSIGVDVVPLGDLARRRIPSRCGTDFAKVVDDILARRVREAVVVTDGVGPVVLAGRLAELRRRGVRVGLVFPGVVASSPLDAVVARGARVGLELTPSGSSRSIP